MSLDTVSILDGSTFVVSDRRGDLDATPTENHGLFLEDTRVSLALDPHRQRAPPEDAVGRRAGLLQGPVLRGGHDRHRLRRLAPLGHPPRCVTTGFEETIAIHNHAKEPIDLEVKLEAAADFADLFEVKDKLAKKGKFYRRVEDGALVLGYQRETFQRETVIKADKKGEIQEDGLTFKVKIPPHGVVGELRRAGARTARRLSTRARAAQRRKTSSMKRDLAGVARSRAPAGRELGAAAQIYRRSLIDLAALRFEIGVAPGALPAAGLPWFMAMFGRDSLITSFQALPFAPELTATTLRALAAPAGAHGRSVPRRRAGQDPARAAPRAS